MIQAMRYSIIKPCLLAVLGLSLVNCATSPTGQKQLKLFPDNEMSKMGITAYEEMKQKTPISTDQKMTAYVNCVANAITSEVPSKSKWEVTLFDDDAINAFALPGGKIGVYTGLLRVAVNQDQLAAVIGHEVAHVIANHGNARVSAAYATESGIQLAQKMAGAASPQKSQLFGLLGLGVQVGVLLPYGRSQESEADYLGLQYMARAGFDPKESVQLWKNMGAASGGKQPPQFLSTHPSHQTRINDLNNAMPKAQQLLEKARLQGKNSQCG
jgi:predicted Zn-dependent protease